MRSLYLIRHGKAAPRGQGLADADRPLTEEGAREAAQAARGFARLARPTLVLTSPLLRARQTAELFAKAIHPPPRLTVLDKLGPVRDVRGLLALINAQDANKIALVGHEPDMSQLTARLTAGAESVGIEFKKAAACRIDFEGKVAPGSGVLVWLIPPKVLRAIRP